MGNQQSSVLLAPNNVEHTVEQNKTNKGQNMNNTKVDTHVLNGVATQDSLGLDTESDSMSDEESDDEEDEELMERLRILEDAKQLKRLAAAFLHPEKSVEVDAYACARCYFDRPSAPDQETMEEAEERHAVLRDAMALKQLANDYAHPEKKVQTSDYLSFARCYFDRPSAPEQESAEYAEERALILQDVTNLRRAAIQYLHPEVGVVTSDSTACARCYFDRASAPEQESAEYAEERRMALADAAALKKLAVDYLHPEVGVVTSDSTACARCYFDRASAKGLDQNTNIEPTNSKPTTVTQASSPVAKDIGTKMAATHADVNIIRKSASSVQLYGLDEEHDDPSVF